MHYRVTLAMETMMSVIEEVLTELQNRWPMIYRRHHGIVDEKGGGFRAF